MSITLALGHGHTMAFGTDDGRRSFIDVHFKPGTTIACSGSGRVVYPGQEQDAGEDYWLIEQEEPLTLSPSLRCAECNEHGFVRNGRWEPA